MPNGVAKSMAVDQKKPWTTQGRIERFLTNRRLSARIGDRRRKLSVPLQAITEAREEWVQLASLFEEPAHEDPLELIPAPAATSDPYTILMAKEFDAAVSRNGETTAGGTHGRK